MNANNGPERICIQNFIIVCIFFRSADVNEVKYENKRSFSVSRSFWLFKHERVREPCESESRGATNDTKC